jgi:GNAT superfamily N-acetyltransferase
LHPLDDPIYQALQSADSRFNLGDAIAGYFPADVSPFAALPDWSDPMQEILYERLPKNRSWSILLAAEPSLNKKLWEIKFEAPLWQMVCGKPVPVHNNTVTIEPLTSKHVPAMLALTAATKPGPFYANTLAFGNYHGIFDGDQLVAMAGERLHLNAYTEISAVCTDPAYTGRGYAALLISFLAEKIVATGKTPFLHVLASNERAISVYHRLGFTHRTDIYFKVFQGKERIAD